MKAQFRVLIVPSYDIFITYFLLQKLFHRSHVFACVFGEMWREKEKPLVAQTLTKPAEVSKPTVVHRCK